MFWTRLSVPHKSEKPFFLMTLPGKPFFLIGFFLLTPAVCVCTCLYIQLRCVSVVEPGEHYQCSPTLLVERYFLFLRQACPRDRALWNNPVAVWLSNQDFQSLWASLSEDKHWCDIFASCMVYFCDTILAHTWQLCPRNDGTESGKLLMPNWKDFLVICPLYIGSFSSTKSHCLDKFSLFLQGGHSLSESGQHRSCGSGDSLLLHCDILAMSF